MGPKKAKTTLKLDRIKKHGKQMLFSYMSRPTKYFALNLTLTQLNLNSTSIQFQQNFNSSSSQPQLHLNLNLNSITQPNLVIEKISFL